MVVKHLVANADVDVQWPWICLHLSSSLRQRPSKELRFRRPTRRKAEKRNSVANSIRFTGGFNLCQDGLTSSKTNGGAKVASRSVVWTSALNLIDFSFMRHMGFRELRYARDSGPQHLLQ